MEPTRVQWASGVIVVLGIALLVVGLVEFRPHVVFFLAGGFALAVFGVSLYAGEARRLRSTHPF